MTVAGYAGMLATLAFVLGLVLLVAKLAKRFLPGVVQPRGGDAFTVVQRIPLGQRQGIAIVQRGDMLIGVSVGDGGVRALFTMPAADAHAADETALAPHDVAIGSNFRKVFGDAIRGSVLGPLLLFFVAVGAPRLYGQAATPARTTAPAAGATRAPATTPRLRTLPPAASQSGPRDLPIRPELKLLSPTPGKPAQTAAKGGGEATISPLMPAPQAREHSNW